MAEDEVSPESNYRKNRGVIVGPIIGLLIGATVGFLSTAPTGLLIGSCMGVGLVVGVVIDMLRRRGQQ